MCQAKGYKWNRRISLLKERVKAGRSISTGRQLNRVYTNTMCLTKLQGLKRDGRSVGRRGFSCGGGGRFGGGGNLRTKEKSQHWTDQGFWGSRAYERSKTLSLEKTGLRSTMNKRAGPEYAQADVQRLIEKRHQLWESSGGNYH